MRIRSIKPEFWRSDDVAALDFFTRLLFIGLWSYVDDNGVGDARLSSVTADLFAADLSADPAQTLRRVSDGLDALENGGQIIRYDAGEKHLLYVRRWSAHQLVRQPSTGHDYPLPPGDLLEAGGNARRHSADPAQTLRTGAGEQGSRGAGEQRKRSSSPVGDGAFSEFYEAYPRKVGKQAALRAFDKASRSVDAQTIVEGARRFASDPNLPERRFIPYPATWLNRGGWEDEALPARGGSVPTDRALATLVAGERFAAQYEAKIALEPPRRVAP